MIELIKKKTANNFATDSRQVRSGTLFFALKGERVDGHDFLADVAERGAVGAVVHESYSGPDFGLHLFFVKDVIEALQQMAKEWLLVCGARVVGVTGSVGKTSTKEFIGTLLRQKYTVATSPGNSNSQVGLPLSILNHLKETDQILVQEMGMTEKGQLSRLISIAPPEVAVITCVALVHACNFESLDEIARAKSEIFGAPATKLGIVLSDCEKMCRVGNFPKMTFSIREESADYYLCGDKFFANGKFVMRIGDLPIPGEHNRQNLLAAIAVARYFSLEWNEMDISKLTLPERRLQFVEKKGIRFVNDSYNASLLSMKASLNSLPKPEIGNKTVAVLGEMLELGKFSEVCHREVGEAALPVVDQMICYGEGCKPIAACWQNASRPVLWTCNKVELMHIIRDTVNPGDVVLLKGSRANELWKVLEEL